MSRAILDLLIYCGLRPCEVRNLRLDDFNAAERTLRIAYSKGGKNRVAYPTPSVCKHLSEWLKVRPKCVHNYMFGSAVNKKLGHNSLPDLFKEMLRLVGLHETRNVTPHSMRHVFASRLINEGTDLVTVKELLGHASLSSTEIYTHTTPEKMRAATEQAARQASASPPAHSERRRVALRR